MFIIKCGESKGALEMASVRTLKQAERKAKKLSNEGYLLLTIFEKSLLGKEKVIEHIESEKEAEWEGL